jgi:HNH endonuclease/AP2 domain
LYEVTHTGIVYHEAGSFLNCSDNPEEWTELQQKVRKLFNYEPATGILNHLDGTRAGWLHEGYREVYFEGSIYKEHRIIVLYMLGKFPSKDAQVDHVNQIRDDNRWNNVRIVNHTTNSMNMSTYTNNTSGVMGVSWHKKQQKWSARIMVNKKPIQLGSFEDKEEAIKVRKEAEQKYGFHDNHGS